MGNEENEIFSVIGKLPNYSRLMLKLYKSPEIRKKHKLVLSMGIAYSLSPIDFIPGIIPVAGQLDNLLVMLRCIEKVIDAIDDQLGDKYMAEADMTREELKADIKLTTYTLKSIGKGTVRVLTNTAKFAGYSALYGIRKLIKKKPY